MENSYNLRSYRDAKLYVPHITAILKVFNLTILSLEHFKAYVPVREVLEVVKEQAKILEAHKNKYQKIIEVKGKING